MKLFTTQFSEKKISEAGMAFILLSLLLGYFLRINLFYIIAIVATVVNMIYPPFFYPFAVVWYPLSGMIGHIMSTLILSLIFIVLVIPVGIIRRLMGKTKVIFPAFLKGKNSKMFIRKHTFTSADINHPF